MPLFYQMGFEIVLTDSLPASLDTSPEEAFIPSIEDPLSLSMGDCSSKATTDFTDTEDLEEIEPEEAPLASSIGTIRVLPFESLMSPSVIQAGNSKRCMPAVEDVMVAIPEENLVELNLQADVPHSSTNTLVSSSSVPSASRTLDTHQSGMLSFLGSSQKLTVQSFFLSYRSFAERANDRIIGYFKQ